MVKTGEINLDTINKICIDFHGVLTNGKINLASDGSTKFETVNVKDIAAIREFAAKGWEVYIITSSTSPIIDAYCKKVGIVKIQSRIKENLFDKNTYIFVGDSSFDLEIMEKAYLAFCPADAEQVVAESPKVHRLKTLGGDGVIAEVLSLLCE